MIFVRSQVLQATGYKLRDYDGLIVTPCSCVDKGSRFLRNDGHIYIINCLNSQNTYIISLGVHFNRVFSKEN